MLDPGLGLTFTYFTTRSEYPINMNDLSFALGYIYFVYVY